MSETNESPALAALRTRMETLLRDFESAQSIVLRLQARIDELSEAIRMVERDGRRKPGRKVGDAVRTVEIVHPFSGIEDPPLPDDAA